VTPQHYSVILHHLSPDAKQAGAALPDHVVADATIEKLEVLLRNLAKLAEHHKDAPGVTPEIRIQTAREELQVRAEKGQLRFDSWDTKVGGLHMTADEIIAMLGGKKIDQAAIARRTAASRGRTGGGGGMPRGAKVAILAAVIVAANAASVWMIFFQKPRDLLPRHELLSDDETNRLLKNMAGEYETGATQGDRRLVIAADGTLQIATYGDKKKVLEENILNSHGAKVEGIPALITINPAAVMEIKNSNTVILFGDTYRRRGPVM
jgi:hypothetical protein